MAATAILPTTAPATMPPTGTFLQGGEEVIGAVTVMVLVGYFISDTRLFRTNQRHTRIGRIGDCGEWYSEAEVRSPIEALLHILGRALINLMSVTHRV